jgi:hypothetical protein
VFAYLELVESNAESRCKPPPPSLLKMDIDPAACAALIRYTAEPWVRDADASLETTVKNDHYYLFAICEGHKNIPCRIKHNGLKMNYDNRVKGRKQRTVFRKPQKWGYHPNACCYDSR